MFSLPITERTRVRDLVPPDRLAHLRGLDGLRAIAVMAVVFYHADFIWVQGGFLGVEVFFVISGYLITSLLLVEWLRTDTIDFKAFWLRRARRLLPALFLVLGAVAIGSILFLRDSLYRAGSDILAASTYVDLVEGPWYLEIPAAPTAGVVDGIYQVPVTDLGFLGADKTEGGTYLLVGPESEVPDDHTADWVKRSQSNLNLIATRIIGLEGDAYDEALHGHRVYRYGTDPGEQRFIPGATDPSWITTTPRDMAFWEQLNDCLANEPVAERNRVIFTQLRGLGFEKGRPFAPADEQREILAEAVALGDAIAMAHTFAKSDEHRYWSDRHWMTGVNLKHPDQVAPSWWEVEEIAQYGFEAITTSIGMTMSIKSVGKGQVYLGAFEDGNDDWLDGSRMYELVVPAQVPVAQFWSMTVYDTGTRTMIDNPQGKSDVDSYRDLVVEDDGSVKLYVGPEAPDGFESNWVPSVPGKGFFVYFRLYGPLDPYYDKVWKLGDFRLIN